MTYCTHAACAATFVFSRPIVKSGDTQKHSTGLPPTLLPHNGNRVPPAFPNHAFSWLSTVMFIHVTGKTAPSFRKRGMLTTCCSFAGDDRDALNSSECQLELDQEATKQDDVEITHANPKDSFYGHLKLLNARIQKRASREVLPSDRDIVDAIADSLVSWMQNPRWAHSVCTPQKPKADVQPKLMSRLYLFSGNAIEARLHFFDGPTETYVHNHCANLWSCCLAGQYENCIIQVTEEQDKSHWSFNRTKDELLENPGTEVRGGLEECLQHIHIAGLSYFISSRTRHVVKTCSEDALPQVLTLYIRGVDKTQDTIVLSDEEKPDWKWVNARNIPLSGEDSGCLLLRMREAVIREIQLRPWMQALLDNRCKWHSVTLGRETIQ